MPTPASKPAVAAATDGRQTPSRKPIACRLLLCVGILLFTCYSRAADTGTRWNILFLFADDWGRYASCYKGLDGRPTINDIIKTPNVDRVAREDVLFRNAFVNARS